MRLHLSLALLFVIATSAVSLADGLSSNAAGIATRSACIKSLEGLGSTAIIFDALTKGSSVEDGTPNEEFSWDAQLVTTSGQVIRVQLHCARINRPLLQGTGTAGSSEGYVSELVRL